MISHQLKRSLCSAKALVTSRTAICLKANSGEFDSAPDICSLRHLNESSLLHTVSCRYNAGLHHTLAGPHLISVPPAGPEPDTYPQQVQRVVGSSINHQHFPAMRSFLWRGVSF